LRETFDTDRDGDGVLSTADTFRLLDAGTGVVGHGFFMVDKAIRQVDPTTLCP
jgi:hypothetical protein